MRKWKWRLKKMKQLSQTHTAREQGLNSLNSGCLLASSLLLDRTLTKATSGGKGLFRFRFQVTILRDQDRNEGKDLRAACLLVHIASDQGTHIIAKDTHQEPWRMLLVSWLPGQLILGYFSYIVENHLGVVPPTSGLGPLIPVNSENIRHAHRSIICSRQLLS